MLVFAGSQRATEDEIELGTQALNEGSLLIELSNRHASASHERHHLVAALPQSAEGFPNIPAVTYNGILHTGDLWDFGPKFDDGIVTVMPPNSLGTPYPALVRDLQRVIAEEVDRLPEKSASITVTIQPSRLADGEFFSSLLA